MSKFQRQDGTEVDAHDVGAWMAHNTIMGLWERDYSGADTAFPQPATARKRNRLRYAAGSVRVEHRDSVPSAGALTHASSSSPATRRAFTFWGMWGAARRRAQHVGPAPRYERRAECRGELGSSPA